MIPNHILAYARETLYTHFQVPHNYSCEIATALLDAHERELDLRSELIGIWHELNQGSTEEPRLTTIDEVRSELHKWDEFSGYIAWELGHSVDNKTPPLYQLIEEIIKMRKELLHLRKYINESEQDGA